MTRSSLLALAVALVACSAHHEARTLFEKGDYLGAEQRYGVLVQQDPKDFEALGGRLESRERFLLAQVTAAEKAQAAGDRSARNAAVASALEHRASWNHAPAEQLRTRLQALVETAGRELELRVGEKVAAGRPLEADSLLAADRRLVACAELTPVVARVTASIRELAEQRCRALSADASPYYRETVGRYCRSLGVTIAPAASALPMQRSEWAFAFRLEGAPPALQDAWEGAWRERMQSELRSSVWFADRAPAAVGAFETRHQGRDEARPVHRVRPWTESVPYTEMESQRESYQEPYTDTESYSEQVPYSASESYSYSCGTYQSPRTCTGYRTVTRYRTEFRHRTVTKYRTAYRNRLVPVTHYRAEPRAFEYDAVERTVDFRTQVTARLELGLESKPLSLSLEQALAKTEDEHQVTFESAEVAPQPRAVPNEKQWLASTLDAFAGKVRAALAQHWSDSFCAQPGYDLEAAARCAYGSPVVPDAAMEMLVASIADDPARLPAIVRGPGAP